MNRALRTTRNDLIAVLSGFQEAVSPRQREITEALAKQRFDDEVARYVRHGHLAWVDSPHNPAAARAVVILNEQDAGLDRPAWETL